MHLSSVQVLLLAVVAITLSAQAAESAIAAPNLCSAADVGKGFCITCRTKSKCEVAGLPPVPKGNCTVAGEACTVLVGVATCKPFANTACTCAKPAQCDAYDPKSVLVCLSGGITVSISCSATGKTCVNGACVTPATTTSTASPSQLCVGAPDGYAVMRPLCTRAAYCSGGNSLGIVDCTSGTYFDVSEMNCLTIPPVPCSGCGTGACPDKSNCSKFYICEEGTVLDDETCDADTPVFDLVANECLATGTCTANANCTYG